MSIYWREDEEQEEFVVPEDVLDVAFDMRCRALPVDHADALYQAICEALPWFDAVEAAGLHLIHGAESGNGWERPEDSDELLYLSRRTKLTLRLPREQVEEAEALTGQTLRVAGYDMTLGKPTRRPLSTHSALYSRHVVSDPAEDEEAFLQRSVEELKAIGVRFKKILCGKMHVFRTTDGEVITRSLFVADLSREDAVRLQEQGVGPGRKRGFGVFIPHKTVTKK
ncbi:type I-MYXAN CRISPR-associated protein Cas6/Cmx6 [Thiohalomonas denitrificans]|uniref:CRISPR-associated protein Cas6, subtype MYXAN n=1 Tax=Thiohalomonas denitrificans TaxID=415747 RepID=A0A1G5QE01_9GAMM|nr:type I-MYXAN CRISPR-associated protein Cas6/Cmx6 [Thiohalomonas denitrificans]SCZ59730.1 CRISPR-associated protein Cas6, subtype MYXAN [Thiohalomonas denitrificans]